MTSELVVDVQPKEITIAVLEDNELRAFHDIEFSLDSATIKWGTSTENETKARIITVLLTQPATTYDVTVPGAPVTY